MKNTEIMKGIKHSPKAGSKATLLRLLYTFLFMYIFYVFSIFCFFLNTWYYVYSCIRKIVWNKLWLWWMLTLYNRKVPIHAVWLTAWSSTRWIVKSSLLPDSFGQLYEALLQQWTQCLQGDPKRDSDVRGRIIGCRELVRSSFRG